VPNLPISGLTASATNLGAADVLPVTQTTGVGPVKMTGLQIAGGLLGSTSLTGGTVTTSQPVLNLAQTWNASAVTFTGLRFNAAGASDANSASASLLMDLQVGGSSRFNVRKNGRVYAQSVYFDQTWDTGITIIDFTRMSFTRQGTAEAVVQQNAFIIPSTGTYAFASGNPAITAQDTFLTRRAAANLRLGAADAAAPVAQTLSVQSVVAGTTNGAGANLTITGSQGTGSGAGGSIIFQVAPANGGGGATVQNPLVNALTIGISSSLNTVTFGPIGGTDILSSGSIRIGVAGNYAFALPDTLDRGVNVRSNGYYGFASTGNPGDTADVLLRRDAANTLALRNGVNAQTFRVYNTFTDASNYERGIFRWDSNILTIGSDKSGTGANRAIAFCYGSPTARVADYSLSNNNAWTFSNLVIATGATTGIGVGLTSSTLMRFAAGTTSVSPIRLESGVAPTSPVNGDIWFDGTDIKMRIGGVTKTFTLT